MSPKLFSLILRIGSFLAITPSTITYKRQNIYQKIWAVFIVIGLTVIAVHWFISRIWYYKTFIHIKLVMRTLRHLIKYFFCCYTIFGVCYFNRKYWFKLIDKLQVDLLFNRSRFFYLEFVLANLIFWIIMLYSGYVYYYVAYLTIFKTVIVDLWEWYCMFFYNFLIYAILKMILHKYKELNKSLKHQVIVLKKVEFILYNLQDVVDIFNKLFGWPLLFIIFYASLLFLDYIDDFFDGFLLTVSIYKFRLGLASHICLVLLHSVSFFF